MAGNACSDETPHDVHDERDTRVQSDRPAVFTRRHTEEDHVSRHDAREHSAESDEPNSVDRARDEGERNDEGVTSPLASPERRLDPCSEFVDHVNLVSGRAAAEKRLDEDGVVLKITRRSREDDAATAEHARPVRDAQRRLRALFDEQHRRPVVGETPDVLLEQLCRHERRQVRGRFVEHQYRR